MNDLNEKLWSDAVELYIDSTANDDIDLTDPYVVREIRKKFAELIVQECLQLCINVHTDADRPFSVPGSLHCMEEIREHFGVEE